MVEKINGPKDLKKLNVNVNQKVSHLLTNF